MKRGATLGTLHSDPPTPSRDSVYRGFLFYKPGGVRVLGHFFGTLILTRSPLPAKDWNSFSLAVRADGSMFAGATFRHGMDDIEPLPEDLEPSSTTIRPFVDDFEDAVVTNHFNSSGDHYVIRFDNGWYLGYALRTVTPG